MGAYRLLHARCLVLLQKTVPLQVCGTLTSGGSESIISAVFASIAHQRDVRGIKAPEIVIADTAHAAFWKAARFSGARCIPLSDCWAADSTLHIVPALIL